MNRLVIVSSVVLICVNSATAQWTFKGLPKDAVIVEFRTLRLANHPSRTLVLWMISLKKNPTSYAPNDVYSCPDQSRGSYYSGPTRVSLVNAATNTIINTIKVSSDSEGNGDSFDLPYAIRKGYYYQVNAAVRPGVEAKPTIMALKDYNGDGKPLEFALFDAEACMGLATALIGYSEKQDRVIQYRVRLNVVEGSKHSTEVTTWPDYLFERKPQQPGRWRYEIDYRGRAGSLDKWQVRYNPAKEEFEGTLTRVEGEP